MNTLITGATGLVGHALSEALLEVGHSVRAVVRDVERARAVLSDAIELVPGDLLDPDALNAAAVGIELVFHAAGMPEQFAADETVFDRVNRQGTANVMQAALKAGVERVVHTSTMDVFAAERGGTLVETRPDTEPKPTAYERSKVAAELEAEAARAEGLQVVFVNPSAVYGPSPSRAAINGAMLELAHGKVPMLPPGGMSLVFAPGLAKAHVRAAEVGVDGERYLVSDTYATLAELAAEVGQVAGLRRIPPTGPAWLLRPVAAVSGWAGRRFGIEPLVAPSELSFLLWQARVDASKAIEVLGHSQTPLAEGVERTFEDFAARGWWTPR